MKYLFALLLIPAIVWGQEQSVPYDLHPIKTDRRGKHYMVIDGQKFKAADRQAKYTLKGLQGNPQGTATGIQFDFSGVLKEGTIYYGLIPYGETAHPQPVFFKRGIAIKKGRVHIPIKKNLEGRYDMVGWETKGTGVIGFRVVDHKGRMLYDGRVHFEGTGPFTVGSTITEGPFVNCVTPTSATISWSGLRDTDTFELLLNGEVLPYNFTEKLKHEVVIDGLEPDSQYRYTIRAGKHEQTHLLTTFPEPGSKKPFKFAYASDSRSGSGGGERSIHGANVYIIKKMAALAVQQNASFFQFSGDLIDGYVNDPEDMHLQYANWKRAIEPFSHELPWYISFGNHESLSRAFVAPKFKGTRITIDRFPYDTESGEVIFAQNFVNPNNGPVSEDGAAYDPNPDRMDFPPYSETVFHYQHGNVAIVVLNSNYWYAPNKKWVSKSSGGLHAYIMDVQLEWFERTMALLEQDSTVDHIFVTLHTPFFPNGGHVQDDMWYHGNNDFRSYVGGKPLEKGIIERRDELLDIIVNKGQKTIAILTGDEHNYAKTKLTPDVEIYPANWTKPRLERNRTIWQINNGAAGAPYYAQERTPWTPAVSNFSTQNALVMFAVEGDSIYMEVISPDTLEKLDSIQLR
jgi:hypothetical protein